MNMTQWFYSLRGLAGLFGKKGAGARLPEADLFSAKAAKAAEASAVAGDAPPLRAKPSWHRRLLSLRWLPLGNRRKGSPWVQTEMLLQETHPLRHDLGEDDVELVRRPKSKVIYESQPVATVPRQLDTENAYARLRNRAPVSERIVSN